MSSCQKTLRRLEGKGFHGTRLPSPEHFRLHAQKLELFGAAPGEDFVDEVTGADSLDQFPRASKEHRLVGINFADMGVGLRKPVVVIRLHRRDLLARLLGVFSAERLVQVHPADEAAEIAVPVEDAVQIAAGVFPAAQRGVGVEQMPGVEQQPFFGKMHLVEQAAGEGWVGQPQARVPEIFHQKVKGVPLPVKQHVDELRRRVDNLLIGVVVAVSKSFLERDEMCIRDRSKTS